MKSTKPFLLLLTTILLVSSCNKIHEKPEANVSSLKNAFKNDFYIGTALDTNQIKESDPTVTAFISKEFNSISPENCMKSMFIHPEKNKFDFNMADKYVAYGERHHMFIHGHTLIWHSQLAPWMAQIKDSTTMADAMTKHISTIVGKYKGRINSWDVVNEALNEDGTLRKSVFLDTYGKDYLTLAFKLAAKADPKADLYYNDYSICVPAKRNGVIALVKNLQKNGAKIDGIGIQGHWKLDSPSIEEIEKSILDYSALGVKVAFTELDITVLPNPWDLKGADVNQNFEGSEMMNPYPKMLPEAIQTQLAQRYSAIFKLFLKHQDKISRVTFWGANDGQSWLNDWPIKGRTNYPLLFDREFKHKKAYNSVIGLKEEKK
ncbi:MULTISPECIES: endo-1,4-beta-xylanase [unclassified Flavobacterium]|jgi:endo-1,4-beta-xylanase|uniref:endo-1,4-beta-xylanase n=1 Tax=unclassified Flavobacterium TaxID=196869 RepID=UPI0025B93B29|nr:MULTISPECIES: endo-1,4-beta-xylanase [unclassified Flavobacterium]